MPAINFNLISNNVKGLNLTKKQIELFDNFKSKTASSGVLFASKTHSIIEIKQKWKDELNGQTFVHMENVNQ